MSLAYSATLKRSPAYEEHPEDIDYDIACAFNLSKHPEDERARRLNEMKAWNGDIMMAKAANLVAMSSTDA